MEQIVSYAPLYLPILTFITGCVITRMYYKDKISKITRPKNPAWVDDLKPYMATSPDKISVDLKSRKIKISKRLV